MKEAPSFLKEAKAAEAKKGIDKSTLSSLAQLIQAYDQTKKEMEDAEKYFKMKKEQFNNIALQSIPEFLLSHGMNGMDLKDGRKLKVKEDISVTIAKADEPKFRQWLKDRKEDDILKVSYSFARMDSAMLDHLSDFLVDGDYEYDIKEGVHPQTKVKYFKELLKDMNRDELPEWVKIFDIRKATVK